MTKDGCGYTSYCTVLPLKVSSEGIRAAAGDTSGILLRHHLPILLLIGYDDNVVDKLNIFLGSFKHFLSDTKGDSGELGYPGAVGQKVRNGPRYCFIQ